MIGDGEHGSPRDPLKRLCLHATRLGFVHPGTRAPIRFDSPAPPALRAARPQRIIRSLTPLTPGGSAWRASPFSLEGKVAIVTGGGVGIGKSIAIEFARAGADVAIASRKIEHLEPVTAEIRSSAAAPSPWRWTSARRTR